MTATETDDIRDQLLKLAHDLPHLVNARSKPDSVVLAEAKAKRRAASSNCSGGSRSPNWPRANST